jgi:cbb3-type cytochrome oxidase maturation protein
MNNLLLLIPLAILLGAGWLVAFLWTMRSNQYEDLDGAAWRALNDDPPKPDDKD